MKPPPGIHGTLALGAVAVGLAALTGGLASPLVGLPAVWLFLLADGALRRVGVHLLVAVLLVLGVAGASLGGAPGLADAAGALFLVGGLAAGRLRRERVEERESIAERRLAAIDSEVERQAAPVAQVSAARRVDDLREALVVAAATANAERAVLWEADLELRRVSVRMASDGPPGTWWLPMAGTPLGWLSQEGQPLRFEARPPVTARFANVLAVRLEHDASRAMLLAFEFGPDGDIPDPDRLAPVAEQVQHVLDEQAERAAHTAFRARVDILLDTLGHLPESVEPGRFSGDLVRDACRLTSTAGGALVLWNHDEGRVLAADGEDGGPPVGARMASAESEVALAARAGGVVHQHLAAKKVGPPHIVAPQESWQRRPAHLLCVPLPLAEPDQALLCVWSATPIDPQGSELLERLAPFAGSQLARALEFGRVRESAERDALTSLPNRRAFDRALDHERVRYERYRHPVALLVVDVDHFKAVNDTHGHEAGDAVLRAVADCLRGGLREIDTIARFGGEEFVILMPETALPAAAEVAERLRESVEADRVEWHGTRVPVRVSIGVSSCPAAVAEPADLVRSADAALYQAKAGGRNRVVSAPLHPEQRAPDPARRRRGG